MIEIKDLNKKRIVYQYILKDKKIDVVNCEESIINQVQKITGDIYNLKYLGVDGKYEFYLALEKEKVLGYSIVQKYFENYYISMNKGRMRGELALVYSLERNKGVGSLLFLTTSFEILKNGTIEIFRCETVKGNVFDKLCLKLDLNFVEEKKSFNTYELILERNNRQNLEKKIKEHLKLL